MTMPTAAQIEAAVAQPTYSVELYVGGSWVDVSDDVVSVDGDYSISAASSDGIGFGIADAPTQTIVYSREQIGVAERDTPIRVKLGFEGTNPTHFLGTISAVDEDETGGSWTATGFADLITAAPEIRTALLYRRPIFTATTATSNETAAGGAGLGNIVLWGAGGRPLEQSATYSSALFYYSTETAIMAPEWTWANGGDAASLLDELCRAAGGVLYQDEAGVVRYQEPFSYGAGSSVVHYTDDASAASAATRVASNLAQYADMRRSWDARGSVVDVVRCAYVARRLQGVQQIYRDTTPRLIEASSSVTITLDLTLPCYRVSAVKAVGYTLRSARAVTAAELTVSIGTTYAQQVSVTIANTLTETVGVSEITLNGQPLVAMEEGTTSYGTAGTRPRSYAVPDSVFIQSKSHADRLCRMYHDWYSAPRPPVTFTAGYDPRIEAGDVITVTNSVLGISAEQYRIASKSPGNTGIQMEIVASPLTGLPVSSDFFVLGTTYGDSDQRQVSY